MMQATTDQVFPLPELTPTDKHIKNYSYDGYGYYLRRMNEDTWSYLPSGVHPPACHTDDDIWLNNAPQNFTLMHSRVPIWKEDETGKYAYISKECLVPVYLPNGNTAVHDCFVMPNSPIVLFHLVDGTALLFHVKKHQFVTFLVIGCGDDTTQDVIKENVFLGFMIQGRGKNEEDMKCCGVTSRGTVFDYVDLEDVFDDLSVFEWESKMTGKRRRLLESNDTAEIDWNPVAIRPKLSRRGVSTPELSKYATWILSRSQDDPTE